MTIKQLQTWVEDDWTSRPKGRPSLDLQLLYILEELGEVAEAVRKNGGLKQRKHMDADIGSEIADLVVSVVTLANHFEIDIQEEVGLFQSRLQERHLKGF